MARWLAFASLIQAVVYAYLATDLGPRWSPMWVVLGGASLAQLVAVGALLADKQPKKVVGIASAVSIFASCVVLGLYAQVAVHLQVHFGPVPAKQAAALQGEVAILLPYYLGIPLLQAAVARMDRSWWAGAAALWVIALVGPPLSWQQALTPAPFAEVDKVPVTAWIHARLTNGDAAGPPPEGPGPVAISVTKISVDGVTPVKVLEGDTLGAALAQLPARKNPEESLFNVEIARYQVPALRPILAADGATYAPPGVSALQTDKWIASAAKTWRMHGGGSRMIAPNVRTPTAKVKGVSDTKVTHWLRMDAWLVGPNGVIPMVGGWAEGPDLTADAALDAAVAGGRFLMAYMRRDGRFTYKVLGPSGKPGRGYNYPRHAGTTWYLARLASRTGDEVFYDAAKKALGHLGRVSQESTDGRAFILDPARDDGKAWSGTNALALLAAFEIDARPDLQEKWTKHLVSAVDERGVVRGDWDIEAGEWPSQHQVTYAQGQGVLALAMAVRAGHAYARPALERAVAHVDGAYSPWPGGRLFTADEHWMCMGSLVAAEVLGRPVGKGVCQSYLYQIEDMFPDVGSPIQPTSGFAAGIAEAVIARAEMDRRDGYEGGRWYDVAMAYGASFLANQYRAADEFSVGDARLIGAFRDAPWALDVQIDAVQHVGCALLGIEQLLRNEVLPGAMP
jgi:hypothetical protein